MTQIYPSINLLCQILYETGIVSNELKLQSEDIRQAKFNSDRVVFKFKSVLTRCAVWCIIYYSKFHNMLINSTLSFHSYLMNQICHLYDHYNINFIQTIFSYCGYNRTEFYTLSSNSYESRELLLVLAWVLAKFDIFTIYLKLLKNEIKYPNFNFMVPPLDYTFPFDFKQKYTEYKDIDINNNCTNVLINSILYLNGQFNHTFNRILAKHRYRTILTIRLAKLSKHVHPIPSHYELYLLSHPLILKSQQNSIHEWLALHSHINDFEKYEKLLFLWFNSVLELSNTTKNSNNDNEMLNIVTPFPDLSLKKIFNDINLKLSEIQSIYQYDQNISNPKINSFRNLSNNYFMHFCSKNQIENENIKFNPFSLFYQSIGEFNFIDKHFSVENFSQYSAYTSNILNNVTLFHNDNLSSWKKINNHPFFRKYSIIK